MSHALFLEPVDVLFLRGNRLFGEAGSYGESQLPPWPSVAAGAIRSRMLVDDGVDLAAFARGEVTHPSLGTPQAPGSFRLRDFRLARRKEDRVEPLYPLPADLVASRTEEGELMLRPLRPVAPAQGLQGSHPLTHWPVMASDTRGKPESGLWLNETGWKAWLNGDIPSPSCCLSSDSLWRSDFRIGVGLDTDTRRADDGKLFSMQAVALTPGYGFLVHIDGAEPPIDGLLRFGGDGRAVRIHTVAHTPPAVNTTALARAGRCRLILTSPALFADGWRLPGMTPDGRIELKGLRGRVVSASIPRAEVISGWDLSRRRPKPAERAVPAGSVYWIEELETSADALDKLVTEGIPVPEGDNGNRQAEGFNRFTLAHY
ncbi:type III-B CRISPR module-associated Cmr3 family protein [Thiolapillus sp.]